MAPLLATAGRVTAVTMDEFDITGLYHEYKFKRDAALIDVTPFGNRVSTYLAGIQKSNIELKGFYEKGHDLTVHQRFGQDQDVNVSLAPAGYGLMKPLIMMPTVIVKYDLSTKIKDAVMTDTEFALRGFVDDGFQLTSPLSILTATGTGSDLDNGALAGATTGGCSAQLHVWSVSGTTPSLTMKIQDSADGTTWADLLTFNAVTVPGVQRIVLDTGNTVRQHVRANWTITGTGTQFRALTGFARGVVYS
jgi:hypothetical protein